MSFDALVSLVGMPDFWKTLTSGATVQSVIARQRWDVDVHYSPESGARKMYTRIAALAKVDRPCISKALLQRS